ncbi:MAG: cellulase family glycosylhydrolase [Firmicutes bacterium]|nr:cellulase family glycosylhydrolase [Bacillota bacterium]
MLLKGKSYWVFLLVLVVLITIVILNLCPAVQASTASQMIAAMGAGWNLGNQLEANNNGTPSETAWGNPTITPALITAVKNAGFKTIRIPIALLNKIGPAPNYTIDAAWLARIKEVVDYAYSQGLYVLLDLHGDGYETVTGAWLLVEAADQAAVKAKFKAVWQQLATTFKDYDERLIFESMNEVFDGNYYDPYGPVLYGNLNAYNQIFVDTVRQTGGNNASRWLLIPGWNTNIDYTAGDYGFVIPTDNYRSASIPSNEKRIMISVHYYTPWEFCGDQSGAITQWGSIATNPSKVVSWGGNEDYMESQFKMMYYKFVTQGYPVVCGEWGVVDKTKDDPASNTYRQYFAKTLATNCKKYGAVPVWWDNGHNGDYGFALFNRSTYAVTQSGIISSIMSGVSANVTPGPAPTPTPTPAGPGANISIQYKCNDANASTSGIRFSFQVQNNDTVTVPLSSVKVRYWYTRDDGKWQSFNCYYAVVGSGNVTGSMVRIPLSSALNTADFYTEVGFKPEAGSLSPGANSGEVQITLTKYDNSNYNQTNDYSFNSSMSGYGANMKVTGYVNGILVFGTEPSGSTPPPATPTPTARPNTPAPTTRRVTPTPTRRGSTPTPTRRVTPTPTRRAATPTPTVRTATPTPATGSGGYIVTYVITSDWGVGANADVTIRNNTATAVNGWTLNWAFPGNQTITNLWNGTYTQSGASVSVKDAGYNATIGANGGTVSFGFGMNYSGTNAKPTAFTLNGTACAAQ